MKKLFTPILFFFVLHGIAQPGRSVPGAPSASLPAYFIDGYHGGIYGHIPSWQTKFMVEKLGQYPDWQINLELEPESWDTIKVNDPASYAAFQKLIADQSSTGRIEYVNPCYGQSYQYTITGESIIRQFKYGMRKLREHFPSLRFTSYSSEEPCFTSALPQILRSYGFSYASLKNPNTCWGGYTRAFGGELVNWIGPDGTPILTSPRYEIEALKPRSIWETIASSNSREYVQKAFAYGIKHPIGMTLQDAGWQFGPWLRSANVVSSGGSAGFDDVAGADSTKVVYAPTVYTTWRNYFEHISGGKADRDWKLSQEDIQVGLMWGAQVLQKIARQVRFSENSIVQTEKMAAMASVLKGAAWPDKSFDDAWRTLLLSQHHDCWIVPYNGKKGDTWADKVVRWTGFTNATCDSIGRLALRRLSGGKGGYVRVYNTTAAPREEIVRYQDRVFLAKVPALGYTSYKVNALPLVTGASVVRLKNGVYRIETDLYKILIDPAKGGAITSWVAKKLGNKEFVEDGKAFNTLRGNFYNAGGIKSSTSQTAEVAILENNPAEIKVAIKGQVAGSPFTQQITLQQGQPRVDMLLTIDWKDNPAIGEYFDNPKDQEVRKAYYDDRFKLLTLFPLNLSSQKIYKNAPFDVTESRLTNTFYNRWDSIKNNVLLNWVDVTDGQGKYGMALFCDHTTSYAHGEDFPLGLTVQYSGNGIFYRNYVIDGPTEVRYALLPHAGKWDQAGIWTAGTEWNEPLIVTDAAGAREMSLLETEKGVEISSMIVDGSALQVRLFNAGAKEPSIRLYFHFDASVVSEVELNGQQQKTLPVHTDKTGRRYVEIEAPRFAIRTINFEHAK